VVEEGELVVRGQTGSGGILDVRSNAVVSGTGVINSTVEQAGILSPGEGIGTLTVSNQINAVAGSVLRVELGGTNDHDRLLVSGAYLVAGELQVSLTNAFTPASGDRLTVAQSTLLIDSFQSASLPTLTNGLGWEIQYADEAVTLVVTGTIGGAVGSISGSVWVDGNGDGVPDPEDQTNGIAGVTVTLSGDTLTNAVLTGAGGTYSFTGLVAGTYTVTETDQEGYASTMDVDGTNDNRIVITLAGGENVTNQWFMDRRLSAYEIWSQRITNEADRADGGDADGDGYANLWEYSQGSDPTNGGSGLKLEWYRSNGVAVVRFNRVTGAVDLVYVVEAGYGLGGTNVWEVIASNGFGLGWNGDAGVTETNSGSIRQVMTEDTDPTSPRRAMRVRITRP